MKFPSEGEFWHFHFAGNKLGASNQMFQAKKESENKKSPIFYSTYCILCDQHTTQCDMPRGAANMSSGAANTATITALSLFLENFDNFSMYFQLF